jgi:hypothetical protein
MSGSSRSTAPGGSRRSTGIPRPWRLIPNCQGSL